MTHVLEYVKDNHADWMRGAEEPLNWNQRLKMNRQQWTECWHFHERNLAVQHDMEFFAEAAYILYQNHLDSMIMQNHLLWKDFCRKLGTTEVDPKPSHVIPEPERPQRLWLLHLEKCPDYELSPYGQFSYPRLVEFVEAKKEMTRSSYRHLVEHQYTQLEINDFSICLSIIVDAKNWMWGFHTSRGLKEYHLANGCLEFPRVSR